MKNFTKTLIAIASIAAVSLSVLSGCGGGSSDSEGTSGTAASGSSGSAAGSESKNAGDAVSNITFPLETPEKFSLAAMRQDVQPPVKDVEMVKQIVEAANVEIEWIDWPASAVTEKKSLAFASGDYPDAIMGAWITDTTECVDYASQGFLLPIEQYFNDQQMPNFNRVLEARPNYQKELTTPDGHIYALPSITEVGTRTINDTVNINREWLDKLNLTAPTTTEELYGVLKAFKEAGDVNGNGKSDEIPMVLKYGDHMRGIYSIMGYFGLPGSQSGFNQRDGKVLYTAAQPEYKEALKFLNRLYSEGLIDPECFTVTTSAYVAKVNAKDPFVGVMVDWSREAANTAIGREVFELLPPLKSSDDVTPVWQARVMPLTSNLSFLVTNKAKNPELILKWVDLFYEKDTSIQNYYGTYDKFVKHVDGVTYDWILNAEGQTPTYEERYPYVQTNRGVWAVLSDDFQFGVQTPDAIASAEAMEIYDPYVEKDPVASTYWLTSEETSELTIIQQDIAEYVKNSAAQFISKGGVDEGWDNYIKTLEGLQLDRYVAIKQAAFDRQK